MHITVASGADAATKSTPGSGSEKTNTPGSGTKFGDWLVAAASAEFGADAGYGLSILTGYPETSCYYYVAQDPAKRRRAPDHFIRKLFHSEQGGPFLRAFMRDCQAKHWLDIERAERIAAQVDALDLR